MKIESRFAWFGRRIVPIDEARISILSSSVNYGLAVFEGIRAYWLKDRAEALVFRLADHIERLRRNARILFMDLPLADEEVADAVLALLAEEAIRGDAYVRPLLYRADHELGPCAHIGSSELSMFATPLARYANVTDGVRVVVSSWRRTGDASIPPRGKIAGSYVNAALAKSEAILAGADDAILLGSDGTVSEATVSNLFAVRGGRLVTPPVSAGILEGITRDTVIVLARELGLEVVERAMGRSELYVADELFLVGTATEVAPVVEIDRRAVGNGKPGPVACRLADALDEVVHGRSAKHASWCRPVPVANR
ncbi:MAG: branched-chain amino acid transaminase [Candidatus Bipolaricaulota bacterium]